MRRLPLLLFIYAVLMSCSEIDEYSSVSNAISEVYFKSHEKVIVRNDGKIRYVDLLINNKTFYSSFNDIVAASIETADNSLSYKTISLSHEGPSSKDSLLAIWYNTARRTTHNTPLTSNYWMHHPILFFNSIGNGICDDVANINESIWASLNYPSRTWYLEGHVVSEVFVDSTWMMLDSDIGYYIQNDSILSVQDLLNHPDLLRSSELRRSFLKKTEDWSPDDWEHLFRIFEKGSGLIDTSNPELDSLTYDYSFPIPPSGEIIFGKGLVDPPINFELDAPNYYNLIIKCDYTDSLALDLFLYPVYLKGSGQVIINNEEFSIEECDANFFIERFNSLNSWHSTQSIVFKNAKNLEIAYMINGYIFDLFESDRKRVGHQFKIVSDGYENLRLKKSKI